LRAVPGASSKPKIKEVRHAEKTFYQLRISGMKSLRNIKIISIMIILPLAYMGFIWYLSSKPSDAVVNTGLPFDNLLKECLHLIEFAVLYLLWVIAFTAVGRFSRQTNKLSAAISVLYAFTDELHQYFIPCRSATITDLLKDTAGVVIAYLIIKNIRSRKKASGPPNTH
jgi:glycopeptide antibiotics resistance protein